jgi:hypothetical protein
MAGGFLMRLSLPIGGIVSRNTGTPGYWEYSSLAVAEASGDSWQNGDTVQITSKATFLYFTALELNGHSGLIHDDPFDDGGSPSAMTVRENEGEGTDPDTWDYTDNGSGVKGTDYEHDTDSGYSRMRDILADGRVSLSSTANVNSADVETFHILRKIKIEEATPGGTDIVYMNFNAYVSGSAYNRTLLIVRADETPYYVLHGASSQTSTGINAFVERDLWIYVKAGSVAIWTNDDATPAWTGDDNSPSGTVGYNSFVAGRTEFAGTTTITLKTVISGGFST